MRTDLTPETKIRAKAEIFTEANEPDMRSVLGFMKGVHVATVSVPGSRLQNSAAGNTQIADGAVTTSKLAATAVTAGKISYEVVTVTIGAGTTSGTATATSAGVVSGHRPIAVDQIIKAVSISGTTVTVTLLANATAQNQIEVFIIHT